MTPILSQSDFDARFNEMSQLQDAAARLVLPNVNALISGYRLCGGTALSRFHLKHRISYDLDFFVPAGFLLFAIIELAYLSVRWSKGRGVTNT